MSDDWLKSAAQALRDTGKGGGEAGPLQRRRVLAAAHANRVAGERRAAVGAVLGIVFATSTAVAAATGQLPAVVRAIGRAVGVVADPVPAKLEGAEPDEPRKPVAGSPAGSAGKRMPDKQADAKPPSPPPVVAESPAAEAPAAAPPPENLAALPPPANAPAIVEAKKPQLPAKHAPAGESHAHAEGPPAAEPAAHVPPPLPPPVAEAPGPDPVLALFRQAQRLQHQDRDYAAALAAWNAYLAQAPKGELAPEARWNRAMCLLRLKRKLEARAALEPFATGGEGGYRQAEAQKLLAAMDEAEP